jgi:hypothetical protein
MNEDPGSTLPDSLSSPSVSCLATTRITGYWCATADQLRSAHLGVDVRYNTTLGNDNVTEKFVQPVHLHKYSK